MTDYRGKRVTVMGLGRFGGGVGAARFLASRGAAVTVTDLCTAVELSDSLTALQDVPLAAAHLGGHREQDFRTAEIIVRSPAVPQDNRFVQIGRQCGALLTSEMNLFWQHNRGRAVAVTGSNGKSTTAALTHALLDAGGIRCHLGGNIGRSLLPNVDEIGTDDWVVLELSSFQLEDLAVLHPQPEMAIVTNFSANHLDRHGCIDAYRAAKQNILVWQSAQGTAILNAEDRDVRGWPSPARRMLFGESDHGQTGIFADGGGAVYRARDKSEVRFPLGEWLTLPGRHNFQNAAAAACCALSLGAPLSAIETGLRSFAALPHRLQFVAEISGRRFYDDSIATTPESVAAALNAFSGPVVLMAGGSDKGVDLAPFAGLLGKRCKAVALMGQTGPMLQHSLSRATGVTAKHRLCGSLSEAFDWSVGESAWGDVILLSPGCASYDWYRDFRERGAEFAKLVKTRIARKAG